MKNKRLLRNVIFALILVGVFSISTGLGLIFSKLNLDDYFFKFIRKIMMSILVLGIIGWYGYRLKFTFSRNFWIFSFLSVCLILWSYYHVHTSIDEKGINVENVTIIGFLIYCLGTGIFEELLFRKLTFRFIMDGRRNTFLLKGIIISSIVFALAHSINLFSSQIIKLSVIIQILFAFGVGFFLQSLYVRFNSLILVITLHGVTNFLGLYQSSLINPKLSGYESSYSMSDFWSSLISVILLNLILIAVSKVILRKKFKEIKSDNDLKETSEN